MRRFFQNKTNHSKDAQGHPSVKAGFKKYIAIGAVAAIVIAGGVFAGLKISATMKAAPGVQVMKVVSSVPGRASHAASGVTAQSSSAGVSSAIQGEVSSAAGASAFSSASSGNTASTVTDSVEAPSAVAQKPAAQQVVPGGKVAYLTFDDGPTEFTPKVLEILRQSNVHGTFFIAFMGQDTPQKRAWIKQTVEEGNALGIHSWTHSYPYIYASEQNFLTDFTRMRDVIRAAAGVDPKICRFPGGIGNTVSLTYHHNVPIMQTLVGDVQKMGYQAFDWNAGGQDAQQPRPRSGQQFANTILSEIGNNPHPIILMHDRYQVSVDALPIVINGLRARGYSFETLASGGPSVMQHPAPARVYAKK